MVRYFNYVVTALLIMILLPALPVLAILSAPLYVFSRLVMPSDHAIERFSWRRMLRSVRRMGLRPNKKAMALYVFWLYCHLVFLGVFSTGAFALSHMTLDNFWPFNAGGDIGVYDITEFMFYTGLPLFFILVAGLSRGDELGEAQTTATVPAYNHRGTPVMAAPARPVAAPRPAAVPVAVYHQTDARVATSRDTAPSPTYAAQADDLRQLLARVETMDAELQGLKQQLATRLASQMADDRVPRG